MNFIKLCNPLTWPMREKVNFIESFYLIRFFIDQCGLKKNNWKIKMETALVIIAMSYLTYIANTVLYMSTLCSFLGGFVLSFFYMHFFLHGKPGRHVILYMVAMMYILLLDSIMLFFYCVVLDYNLMNPDDNIGILILGIKLLEATIYEALRKYLKRKEYGKIGIWAFPVFIPGTMIYTLLIRVTMNYHNEKLILYVFLSAQLLVVSLFLIVNAMNKMYYETSEKDRLQYEQEEIEKQVEYLHQMECEYERLKEERHDLQHHIRFLKELAARGDYDQIGAYLKDDR